MNLSAWKRLGRAVWALFNIGAFVAVGLAAAGAGSRLASGGSISTSSGLFLVSIPAIILLFGVAYSIWSGESLPYAYFRWWAAITIGVPGLPLIAGVVATVAPSVVTGVLVLVTSVFVPGLFAAELHYDVPVLTPFFDDGEFAFRSSEVSA